MKIVVITGSAHHLAYSWRGDSAELYGDGALLLRKAYWLHLRLSSEISPPVQECHEEWKRI